MYYASKNKPLIIGIGNEYRGDDALGVLAVQILKDKYPDLGTYLVYQNDICQLLDHWDRKQVIIIDAAFSKTFPPGWIHIIISVDDMISEEQQFSTHGMGLTETLRMGKLLGKLPASMLFLGVEGEQWGFGKPLSDPVKKAIPRLEKYVLNYVETALKKAPSPPLFSFGHVK